MSTIYSPLNDQTVNNDIGLYITGGGRRVVLDQPFGELATWIKATTAGTVIWKNSKTNKIGIWPLEAGEPFGVVCDEILSGATIDGVPEVTSAGGLFWATTTARIGENR
jgi:hypothetical protein